MYWKAMMLEKNNYRVSTMAFAQSELSYQQDARNWHNRSKARQWQTSHTAENIDTVNGLVLSQESAAGTHFAEVCGTQHTLRHSAKVPKETIEAWSSIQQSVIDQAINQWRDRLSACVKAKGKHWTFVVMCLSITVNLSWRVMLGYEQIDTCSVSQGSVMTLIRRDG